MRRTSKGRAADRVLLRVSNRGRLRCHLVSSATDQRLLELGPQGIDPDAADDVVGEGIGQQPAALVAADAPCPQVKQLFLVELADAGAMGTLHVVGVDFQLRFGVNDGIVGQQQRLVGLLGVGLLGVGVNVNLAVEDAAGPAVEDALVQLVAGAIRLGMVDARVVIDQLVAARQVQAVKRGFAALRVEHHVDVRARSTPPRATVLDVNRLPRSCCTWSVATW